MRLILSASAFVSAASRLVSVIVAGACRQRAKCSHTADIACACVEHSDELARRYLPVTDSTRMPALAAVLASATTIHPERRHAARARFPC
jgi:hypothetical protein